MVKKFGCAAVFVAVFSSMALGANTWYVDDNNYKPDCATYEDYEAAGFDGKGEFTAFGTIQIAVDKASAGDKIIVLPGTYDKGGSSSLSMNARVNIDKSDLKVISKMGKAVTHIVGASDPEYEDGIGPNAYKCVHIGASNVILEGFTICGGRSASANTSVWSSRGCAVGSNFGQGNNTIVDCTIYDTISTYSAIFQVNCVRCEIYGCKAVKGTSTAHIYAGKIVNCYVHDNVADSYLFNPATVVNTTVVSEGSYSHVTRNSTRYNSIFECAGGDFYPSDTSSNVTVNAKVLFAPAAGDCHPCEGMAADGAGDPNLLANLNLPDGVDPYIDFEGKTISKTGPISLGCIQTTRKRVGGRIDFAAASGSSYSVDGGPTHKVASYAYSGSVTTQHIVTAGADARLVKGVISGAASAVRVPGLDDAIAVMPPPGESQTITFTAHAAGAELWVAEDGNDSSGDGSSESPYRTIQKAVDAASSSVNTIINVGPGAYGVGEAHYPVNSNNADVTTYGKAAVAVYDKCVRIVSTNGAEETFIFGTADSDYATDETLPGCGPAAVRCVLLAGSSDKGASVSGFTLTGGATARSGDNVSWGGGYFCPSGYNAVTDCIVSNNAAHVCAGGCAGTVERCLFTGNKGDGSTAGGNWDSPIFGCVFAGNPASATASGAICGNATVYNCTLIGESADYPFAQDASGVKVYNSIVVGGNQNCPNMTRSGNVLWGGEPDVRSTETYLNPLLVNASGGDFSVKSISPALGAGDMAAAGYFARAAAGYGGGRLLFDYGAPLCGAVQSLAKCGAEVFVEAANGGVAVEGGSLGYYDLSQSGPLMLVPANGVRPCVGFLVNGVTNLFADLDDGRFPVSQAQAEAAGGMNIRAIYDTHWYVDAENGSDGNPGCAAFPMETLAEGTKYAVSGDTVHAAPGDYNKGLVCDNPNYTSISSRVAVATGVLLVADEGPEQTFITGADSPNPVGANSYLLPGGGPGAVRCVSLASSATIRGFTIRHGRQNGGSNDNHDGHSGGILGANSSNSFAYDCVITNCCGWRGGAVYGVRAVNCRISGCKSASGSAGRVSGFIGCLFGDGCNGAYLDYPSSIVRNCTFLGNQTAFSNVPSTVPVCNSIILGKVSANASHLLVMNNCILATNAISEADSPYVTTNNCIVVDDASEIRVNEDGTLSADSQAVDAGSNQLVPNDLDGLDLAGGQRIYNGTVDIGAFEYDWRPVYGAAINGRFCKVEKASPEVMLADGGKVSVVNTISMTLRSAAPSGRRCKYGVPVSVTGNGTLVVQLNGEEFARLAEGEHMLEFKNDLAANALVLNYEPGADDPGSAVVDAASVVCNGVIMMLR